MVESIDVVEFLGQGEEHVIIDVRTPAEFNKGHIPGAFNVPLFNDEERVVIGILYKQKGRQAAILKGLELVGPRMKDLVNEVVELAERKVVFVHCWRGGMRSGSVAWLLDMYGMSVRTLKGGYKFFRRYVLSTLEESRNYVVLGGRTGSGKTLILQRLCQKGEQVVDLEKLARHKGSAFGSMGEVSAVTQEQFENELAFDLGKCDPQKPIWLEDEGRSIGKKIVPGKLWEQMRAARVNYIDIPFAERAEYLLKEYGKFDKNDLKESVSRITKRLGGMQTKQALAALENNDLKTTCEICLAYYDKSYDHGLAQREFHTIKRYPFDKIDLDKIVYELTKSE